MRNEISPFLISRNSRNSAKQFLFRIIFVFRENKKIDEIDNPTPGRINYCTYILYSIILYNIWNIKCI